jgi:hypothetical protein
VLFVPQQHADDPLRTALGTGSLRVEVRTTERADFFVFNDGDDPSGVGFRLCQLCDRQVEPDGKRQPKTHDTPFGKPCPGKGYDTVHLGHDFISCAVRLTFDGTQQPSGERGFWVSLLHALLGGMADALGIEANDINGVIRPIEQGGAIAQEVVIFDDVPGGAGHSLRLEDEDELLKVFHAAHARVAHCECGETASCYTCLRSYRNQLYHDQLARGPVADYLGRLIEAVRLNPDDDRPYDLPDRAGVVRAALRDNARVDLVASRLTEAGPPESAPWYVLLLEFAARAANRLRIALGDVPAAGGGADSAPPFLPLLMLAQAGAEVYGISPGAPATPYYLLPRGADGATRGRSLGLRWGADGRPAALDGETLRRSLWINRSPQRVAQAAADADKWFSEFAQRLTLQQFLPAGGGCVVHTVTKGRPVDFRQILRSTGDAKITRAVLRRRGGPRATAVGRPRAPKGRRKDAAAAARAAAPGMTGGARRASKCAAPAGAGDGRGHAAAFRRPPGDRLISKSL